MRKTVIIVLTLICSAFAYAQEAETIESIIANSHKPEWYAAQAKAWQKKVEANPNDQWAWRNLFRATCSYDQFTGGWGENPDASKTADVIRKMEAALPDSYVLNLCKGRFYLTTDEAARRGDNIRRAIELMPENVCPEDLEYLAVRLWMAEPESPLVKELFTRSYRSRYFPARPMHYNHNMLLCMQPNALYFANGDLDTVPMKMLQEALDIRTDVTVIPVSFLHTESFRNILWKKLGIKPLELNPQDCRENHGEDWVKHYEAGIIMYLINESKRPAYFSPTYTINPVLDKNRIYNEGLVLKYSAKPYNNFDVAMHNVKEVCHLEYLAEPDLVCDSWETSGMVDMNHVTLLANLISRFRKKGDEAAAARLYNILSACMERCLQVQTDDHPLETKKAYYENLLKEQLR